MGGQNSNIYPGPNTPYVIVLSELFQVVPSQSFQVELIMFSYVLMKHVDLLSL